MVAAKTEETTSTGSGAGLDRKGSKDSARAASSKPGDEESEDVFGGDSIDPVYLAKAHVLNRALQEIGMGRYNWMIFVVTGFGWLADNLWPIVTGLILTPVVNEFVFDGPFLKLAQNIGLLVGAVFWGVGADIWGRRVSFNITLFITGAFALAAGGSANYIALCSLTAVWSVGVGGNLPVDSAIFLEFVPASHQYLLTVLSIWWAFGQLLGSLVAWPLIGNYSCEVPESGPANCPRSANMGWRYFLFAMGGLMIVLWAIRFFLFKLYESPKWLMSQGEDEKAVRVIHQVAAHSGKTSNLTLEELRAAGDLYAGKGRDLHAGRGKDVPSTPRRPTVMGAIQANLAKFKGARVKPLFATRKLAWSTGLLIFLWGIIGLAFPLYNSFVTYYLATRGATFGDGSVYITYRNQVILSVLGVPGALLAGWMVELPLLGRRGTLSISTLLTGVFILASTTARSSDVLLAWNCLYSFFSNMMYGVLYALSPELFPTKERGTGNALTAAANRVFGIMAPIIALYADLTTSVPIFISGALFLVAGFVALLLPFESRGKASI
uniref:Major facilitator superfamily (MFS) profile domain-containing protein n=1 Tax=Schizophyllum commune (strain H4-8 / FGSC 9210) TaxID=578458 RepID=D8Q366_SCHCM